MHFHKIMKAGISWRVRIVAPHISHVLYVFVYEIVKVHSQADACILDKIKSDLSAQKAHKHSPVCYERFCKIMCFTRMTSLEFQLIRSILTDNLQQHLLMHPFRLLIHFTQIFQLHRSK